MLDGLVGGQAPHQLGGGFRVEEKFFFLLESSTLFADLSKQVTQFLSKIIVRFSSGKIIFVDEFCSKIGGMIGAFWGVNPPLR